MAGWWTLPAPRGESGCVGDRTNHWPAVHRLDAASLFRLAIEKAPPGTVLHGVAEQGVTLRGIAEVIGTRLNLPTVSVPADAVSDHFGWLAGAVSTDNPTSNSLTRELLAWQPTHSGLLDDLEHGRYLDVVPA